MSNLEMIRNLKERTRSGISFYTLSIVKTFLVEVGIIFLVTSVINYCIFMITDIEVAINIWNIPAVCLITLIIVPSGRNYLKNCSIMILFYLSRYAVLKTIEGIKDEDERHQALKDFMDRELTMLDR